MAQRLADRVEQGRRAIAIARGQGLDTHEWEKHLNQLVKAEQQQLLAWAAEVAESDLTLAIPITYRETPLRPITTSQVSQSIRRYLKTIASAEIHRATGGWKEYPPEWWNGQANQALGALKALRTAMAEANRGDRP